MQRAEKGTGSWPYRFFTVEFCQPLECRKSDGTFLGNFCRSERRTRKFCRFIDRRGMGAPGRAAACDENEHVY